MFRTPVSILVLALWGMHTVANAAPLIVADSNEEACAACHRAEVTAWRKSHHAKAMDHANTSTVLGDFRNVALTHSGEQTVFTQTGDIFLAVVSQTDKPGLQETFRIRYTFGVFPLQQYLVETKQGKLQALPWAWDTRSASEGGDRWFHLYEENVTPRGDRLHWLSPSQNWNGMCADCHSSGLSRNYDVSNDLFSSTASAINVSCASCHGETKTHIEAMNDIVRSTKVFDKGSASDNVLRFSDSQKTRFERDDDEHTARNQGESHEKGEIAVCAACHSRRTPLTKHIDPRLAFLDQFSPGLLDPGLYHPDGQILDEVYVWGSFMQSKMAAAGVTCTNCHNAHSLDLKQNGNSLCTTCHSPKIFDAPVHHRHQSGSTGALCVNCHMPETTYMGIDARRDHSFKVPRPDLSRDLNTPNACTRCHKDMTNDTAAGHITRWYGSEPDAASHIRALSAARRRDPAARKPLRDLIEDEAEPALTRATALSLVPGVADLALISVARSHLSSEEPLLRMGAIRALTMLSEKERVDYLAPLLSDDLKAVRIEAATALADIPQAAMSDELSETFKVAMAELLEANEESAWRGEGRLNRALVYQGQGDMEKAAAAYRKAMDIDPAFAPSWVNLAELLRMQGQDEEAMNVLLEGLKTTKGDASIHHALGLAYIRQKNTVEAMIHLEAAAKQAPITARFSYVYAVALQSYGHLAKAHTILDTALEEYPFDPDLLNLGLTLANQQHDFPELQKYAERLARVFPDDPTYRDLVTRLSR